MMRSSGSSMSQELSGWEAVCLALSLLMLAPAVVGAQQRALQPQQAPQPQSTPTRQDTIAPAQASDSLGNAAADSASAGCIAANAFMKQNAAEINAFMKQHTAEIIEALLQRGDDPQAPPVTVQLPDSLRDHFPKIGPIQCQVQITTGEGAPTGQ
jgi:hypothetical protein